jgi:A/G-specific adenine glycosylase
VNAQQQWRDRVRGVQDALLAWYARAGRDLPWRRTRDPYAILVSEIMLQQTQVERVLGKFLEFLEAFPDFAALAAASTAEVIRRWTPLGYNRRAVRLQAIAREVVAHRGGQLPGSADELRALDGLGAYTANAVACFAFEQPVAVVDTNVRRVLGRIFPDLLGPQPSGPAAMQRFAESVLPSDRAYDWNQALMDLGATICTARAPKCIRCPVALACAGRASIAVNGAVTRKAAEPTAAYRATDRYEKSARYYRGRIVDRLRELPDGAAISLGELGPAVRPDYGPEHAGWIADLVEGLRRDGLAAMHRRPDGVVVSLP